MRKALFACVVVLLAVGLAWAQKPSPQVTIGRQGLSRPEGRVSPGIAGPTGACANNDCIFYGGDGDPSSPNADGLWANNSSYFGIAGYVYSPFVWSKVKKCGGKCKWGVDGLFVADEMYPTPPTIDSADWSILAGVVAGGTPATATTVCSGSGASVTLTDTGRLYFGFYEEWYVSVPVSGCTVGAKKGPANFWESVTVNTSAFQLAYESNSPSNANAVGTAEPVDQSYFYSPAFGFGTFTNTTGLGPFDTFSAGVCAALTK